MSSSPFEEFGAVCFRLLCPTHETLPAPQHTRKGREKARRRSRPPGGGREKKEGPRTGRGEKEKATKETRRGQEEERDPNSAREHGEEGGVEERAGLRCGEANPNQGLLMMMFITICAGV